MHDKLKGEKIELENARETLGHYFFIKLKEKLRQAPCLIILFLVFSTVSA